MASSGVMSSTTATTMVPPGSSPSGSSPPTGPKRWYFSENQLSNTPSLRAGIALEKELSYRQQAANFIQDMGQRLEVTQLCINTAIVYMQRFYMFHSFTRFHRNSIASASLFLAAKVEEQPRKLEHVIKVAHMCLHRGQPHLDVRSEAYHEQAQELVTNENILLQTLGFDVAIDHPHTHVVKCCQLVKAAKELAQTSYFMATNSLHLTTMCLRYPPTIVACVCIHLACKWSKYRIPLSAQQREWFSYIDAEATHDLLEKLTDEFLTIFEKCPSRLKKKIRATTQTKEDEDARQARGPSVYSFSTSHRDRNSSSGSSDKHHHHHRHGHGHHHRSSSSSTSASQPVTAGVANSAANMANMQQHQISKHANSAVFDPNMRSHRDKSHGGSSSSAKPNPMMNSSQVNAGGLHNPAAMQPQQPPQQQFMVDAYGRPVKQSSSKANPSSSMNRGSSSQQPQMMHHQQRPPSQQQQQQPHMWQDPQQQQRNMSLGYPPQQQQPQKPARPSSHQRHSHGHDSRAWPQNMKPSSQMGSMKPQHPSSLGLPPHHHQQQQQPPLPPSEPPKPQPPPPPMPPSPVTSMKPPKSIFDIDSPPSSHQPQPPPLTQPPPPPITSSTLSQPKEEIKLELPGDIFEPDLDDFKPPVSTKKDPLMSVKLNKVEEMSGFEKLKDGSRSIKVPSTSSSEAKSMVVSIPMTANSTTSEAASSSSSSHKKHKKEKKNKKEKKEKREKYHKNGEVKKHKHKHRDRDREHPEGGDGQPASGLKLKIKPIPGGDGSGVVQPLKICIGGSSSSTGSNSRKRHRQHSDSSTSSMDSMGTSLDPARKMSRVMGTSAEQESSFLGRNVMYQSQKKKVIT